MCIPVLPVGVTTNVERQYLKPVPPGVKEDFQKKKYLDFAQSKLYKHPLLDSIMCLSSWALVTMHKAFALSIPSIAIARTLTRKIDFFGPGIIHWTPYTPLSLPMEGVFWPFLLEKIRYYLLLPFFICHHAFPGPR